MTDWWQIESCPHQSCLNAETVRYCRSDDDRDMYKLDVGSDGLLYTRQTTFITTSIVTCVKNCNPNRRSNMYLEDNVLAMEAGAAVEGTGSEGGGYERSEDIRGRPSPPLQRLSTEMDGYIFVMRCGSLFATKKRQINNRR